MMRNYFMMKKVYDAILYSDIKPEEFFNVVDNKNNTRERPKGF